MASRIAILAMCLACLAIGGRSQGMGATEDSRPSSPSCASASDKTTCCAKNTPAFKPDAWCVANTLLGAIRDESDLSFLAKAIHELDFDDVLSNPTATVSVFAPTDKAWKAYCTKLGMTPAQLLKNNTLLFDTVFGHVVKPLGANTLLTPGLLLPLVITKDPNSQALPKAIPAVLRVRSTKPDLVIAGTTNSAKVVKADIPAGKSIIQKIDAVIVPPSRGVVPAAAPLPALPCSDKKTGGNGAYEPAKTSSAIASGCLSAAVKRVEMKYPSVTKGCTTVGLVDTKAGPVCSQVVAGTNYVFNFKILCPQVDPGQVLYKFFQAKCYDGINADAKIDSVVYVTAP